MSEDITTHDLAKKLLSLPDVPVYHIYTHWDDFDDYPMEYKSTVGINLLRDDNNEILEVVLYEEELVSASDIDYDSEV